MALGGLDGLADDRLGRDDQLRRRQDYGGGLRSGVRYVDRDEPRRALPFPANGAHRRLDGNADGRLGWTIRRPRGGTRAGVYDPGHRFLDRDRHHRRARGARRSYRGVDGVADGRLGRVDCNGRGDRHRRPLRPGRELVVADDDGGAPTPRFATARCGPAGGCSSGAGSTATSAFFEHGGQYDPGRRCLGRPGGAGAPSARAIDQGALVWTGIASPGVGWWIASAAVRPDRHRGGFLRLDLFVRN